MKKTSAVTSCWGGYQGLTLDPLATYTATGILIPLTNQTITIKIQYTCPSTSVGCYVIFYLTWYCHYDNLKITLIFFRKQSV